MMLDLKALSAVGVDAAPAIHRFADDEGLYLRFLSMLPDDECFGNIAPALEKDDYEAALMAAHTLKGLAGSLGAMQVYQGCSDIVQALRAKDYAAAKQAYPAMATDYQRILNYIQSI